MIVRWAMLVFLLVFCGLSIANDSYSLLVSVIEMGGGGVGKGYQLKAYSQQQSLVTSAKTNVSSEASLVFSEPGDYLLRLTYNGQTFEHPVAVTDLVAQFEFVLPERTRVLLISEAGQPLAKKAITAFSSQQVNLKYQRTTNASGEATFSLPSGNSYLFRASHNGRDHFSALTPSGTQTSVFLSDLTYAQVFYDQEPLAAITVQSYDQAGTLRYSRQTDQNGLATFSLGEGTFQFLVKRHGKTFTSAFVNSGETAQLQLPLDSMVSVSGLEAPTRTSVFITDEQLTPLGYSRSLTASSSQSFSLAETTVVRFGLSHNGAKFYSQGFIPPNAATITVPAPTQVQVFVEDLVDITRISVKPRLFGTTAPLNYVRHPDPAGLTTFHLQQGQYEFVALHNGREFVSDAVFATQSALLDLRPYTTIRLTRSQTPLADTLIRSFEGDENARYSRRTDSQGIARFSLQEDGLRFLVTDFGARYFTAPLVRGQHVDLDLPALSTVSVTGVPINFLSHVKLVYSSQEKAGYHRDLNPSSSATFSIATPASFQFLTRVLGRDFFSDHFIPPSAQTIAIDPVREVLVLLGDEPWHKATVHHVRNDLRSGYHRVSDELGVARFSLSATESHAFEVQRHKRTYRSNPAQGLQTVTINLPADTSVQLLNHNGVKYTLTFHDQNGQIVNYKQQSNSSGQALFSLPVGTIGHFSLKANGKTITSQLFTAPANIDLNLLDQVLSQLHVRFANQPLQSQEVSLLSQSTLEILTTGLTNDLGNLQFTVSPMQVFAQTVLNGRLVASPSFDPATPTTFHVGTKITVESDEPQRQYLVQALATPDELAVLTDENQTASFYGNSQAMSYVVSLEGSLYTLTDVAPGSAETLVLPLPTLLELKQAERPLYAAEVRFTSQDGSRHWVKTSDEAGRVKAYLPGGLYSIRVSSAQGLLLETTVLAGKSHSLSIANSTEILFVNKPALPFELSLVTETSATTLFSHPAYEAGNLRLVLPTNQATELFVKLLDQSFSYTIAPNSERVEIPLPVLVQVQLTSGYLPAPQGILQVQSPEPGRSREAQTDENGMTQLVLWPNDRICTTDMAEPHCVGPFQTPDTVQLETLKSVLLPVEIFSKDGYVNENLLLIATDSLNRHQVMTEARNGKAALSLLNTQYNIELYRSQELLFSTTAHQASEPLQILLSQPGERLVQILGQHPDLSSALVSLVSPTGLVTLGRLNQEGNTTVSLSLEASLPATLVIDYAGGFLVAVGEQTSVSLNSLTTFVIDVLAPDLATEMVTVVNESQQELFRKPVDFEGLARFYLPLRPYGFCSSLAGVLQCTIAFSPQAELDLGSTVRLYTHDAEKPIQSVLAYLKSSANGTPLILSGEHEYRRTLPETALFYEVLYSDGSSERLGPSSQRELEIRPGLPQVTFSGQRLFLREDGKTQSLQFLLSKTLLTEGSCEVLVSTTQLDQEVLITPAVSVVSLPVNTLTVSFDLEVIGDDSDDQDALFSLAIGECMGAEPSLNNIAELYVLDDDPKPVVRFENLKSYHEEGAGYGEITLTRFGSTKRPITIHYGTMSPSPSDVTIAATGTVIMPPTTDQAQIGFLIHDDLQAEADELLGVFLLDAVNAVLSKNRAHQALIVDDDRIAEQKTAVQLNILFDGQPNTNPVTVVIFDAQSKALVQKVEVLHTYNTELNRIDGDYELQAVMILDQAPRVKTLSLSGESFTTTLNFTYAQDAGGYIHLAKEGRGILADELQLVHLLDSNYNYLTSQVNLLGPLIRFPNRQGQFVAAYSDRSGNFIFSKPFSVPGPQLQLNRDKDITVRTGLFGQVVQYVREDIPYLIQTAVSDENGEVRFGTFAGCRYLAMVELPSGPKVSPALSPGSVYSFVTDGLEAPPVSEVLVTLNGVPFNGELLVGYLDENQKPLGQSQPIALDSIARLSKEEGIHYLMTPGNFRAVITRPLLLPAKNLTLELCDFATVRVRNETRGLSGITLAFHNESSPEFVQTVVTENDGQTQLLPTVHEKYRVYVADQPDKEVEVGCNDTKEIYLGQPGLPSSLEIVAPPHLASPYTLSTYTQEGVRQSFTTTDVFSTTDFTGNLRLCLQNQAGLGACLQEGLVFPRESLTLNLFSYATVTVYDSEQVLPNHPLDVLATPTREILYRIYSNSSGEVQIPLLNDAPMTLRSELFLEVKEVTVGAGEELVLRFLPASDETALVLQGVSPLPLEDFSLALQSEDANEVLTFSSSGQTRSRLRDQVTVSLLYQNQEFSPAVRLNLLGETHRLTLADPIFITGLNPESEVFIREKGQPATFSTLADATGAVSLRLFLQREYELLFAEGTQTVVLPLQPTQSLEVFQNRLSVVQINSDPELAPSSLEVVGPQGAVLTSVVAQGQIYPVQNLLGPVRFHIQPEAGVVLRSKEVTLPQKSLVYTLGKAEVLLRNSLNQPLPDLTVRCVESLSARLVWQSVTDTQGRAFCYTLNENPVKARVGLGGVTLDSPELMVGDEVILGENSLAVIRIQSPEGVYDKEILLADRNTRHTLAVGQAQNSQVSFGNIQGTFLVGLIASNNQRFFAGPYLVSPTPLTIELGTPVTILIEDGQGQPLPFATCTYYRSGFPQLESLLQADANGVVLVPTVANEQVVVSRVVADEVLSVVAEAGQTHILAPVTSRISFSYSSPLQVEAQDFIDIVRGENNVLLSNLSLSSQAEVLIPGIKGRVNVVYRRGWQEVRKEVTLPADLTLSLGSVGLSFESTPLAEAVLKLNYVDGILRTSQQLNSPGADDLGILLFAGQTLQATLEAANGIFSSPNLSLGQTHQFLNGGGFFVELLQSGQPLLFPRVQLVGENLESLASPSRVSGNVAGFATTGSAGRIIVNLNYEKQVSKLLSFSQNHTLDLADPLHFEPSGLYTYPEVTYNQSELAAVYTTQATVRLKVSDQRMVTVTSTFGEFYQEGDEFVLRVNRSDYKGRFQVNVQRGKSELVTRVSVAINFSPYCPLWKLATPSTLLQSPQTLEMSVVGLIDPPQNLELVGKSGSRYEATLGSFTPGDATNGYSSSAVFLPPVLARDSYTLKLTYLERTCNYGPLKVESPPPSPVVTFLHQNTNVIIPISAIGRISYPSAKATFSSNTKGIIRWFMHEFPTVNYRNYYHASGSVPVIPQEFFSIAPFQTFSSYPIPGRYYLHLELETDPDPLDGSRQRLRIDPVSFEVVY